MTSDHLPEHQGGRRRSVSGPWTIESVRSLGLTTTVDTAASILGISRTKAYALAKTGDFPTRLVRVGRRYLVPIPALLDLLTAEKAIT
jgi:excisionase family DNA binding protein